MFRQDAVKKIPFSVEEIFAKAKQLEGTIFVEYFKSNIAVQEAGVALDDESNAHSYFVKGKLDDFELELAIKPEYNTNDRFQEYKLELVIRKNDHEVKFLPGLEGLIIGYSCLPADLLKKALEVYESCKGK